MQGQTELCIHDEAHRKASQAVPGKNHRKHVYCKAEELNQDGMVCDFTHIKKAIHEKLDHQYLNEILPFNPTAENMARWMCEQIPTCYKVSVQESDGNIATYEKD